MTDGQIDSWVSRAQSLADHRLFAEASAAIQEALKISEIGFEPLMRMGECSTRIANNDLAIECFRRCLKLKSNNLHASFEIAQSYMRNKNFSDANIFYQIVENQNYPMGQILLGYRHHQMEQYNSAINIIHPVLKNFPSGSFADLTALDCLQKMKADQNLSKFKFLIPRNIIQYWDKEIPSDVAQATKIYSTLGGFNYNLFDKKSASVFIQKHYGSDLLDLFLQCTHLAMESVFFRILYLNIFGGYYFDTDELLIDGKKDFFIFCEQQKGGIVLWQVLNGMIANGVIATIARHPILEYTIYQIIRNIMSKINNGIWSITGPGALTRATVNYLFTTNSENEIRSERIYIIK